MTDREWKLSHRIEAMAWGAIFVWLGVVEMLGALPHGIGAAGVGAILLGSSVLRARHDLPANRFATAAGILALVWGVLDVAGAVLVLPFELPVFAILLIVFGVLVLAPALRRARTE